MKTNEEKKGRPFSLLSVVMLVAILHAIGQILLQSFLRIEQNPTHYTSCPVMGLMYASSLLSGVLVSGKMNVDFVNSLSSVFSIVYTLLLVIFSSLANKGKKWPILGLLIAYSLDTLLVLPLLLVNYLCQYPLGLTTVDVILEVVLHVIFLAFFVLLFLQSRKDDDEPIMR